MRSIHLTLVIVVCVTVSTSSSPKTDIRYGKLEGFKYDMENGREANIFLGIPYAMPLGEDNRFEPPVPMKPWKGTISTKQFAASCFPYHKSSLTRKLQYSENCLFFNVMAPARKAKAVDGYPVMVFIHGGSFEEGSAASYGYAQICENFVSQGIVFVTLNYRIGSYGFWSTGDHAATGNAGLWDQTQALEVINENIAAFGGDPQRITLLGHGAGAASVGALSLSSHSNNLFQQTISLSGSLFSEWASSETTVEDSNELSKAVGCWKENNKMTRECMKKKNVVELLKGIDQIGSTRPTKNGIKQHPRFDGIFLLHSAETLMKQAPHIVSMVGITNAEAAKMMFDTKTQLTNIAIPGTKQSKFNADDAIDYIKRVAAPESQFGDHARTLQKQLIDFYVLRRVHDENDHKFYLNSVVELMSDILYNIPAYHEVQMKLANNWTTYFFVQDFQRSHSPNERQLDGMYHGDDLPYLFGGMDGEESFEMDKEDRAYRKVLVDSIVNFVRKSNPSRRNVSWASVTNEHPSQHLYLTLDPFMVVSYKEENIRFWTEVVSEDVRRNVMNGERFPTSDAHGHTEL